MEKGAGTRRRRLVERGTDRLAFIIGQTRSLSADPHSDSTLGSVFEQQQTEGGIGGQKFSDRTHLQMLEPSELVPGSQRADTHEATKARILSYEDELFLKFKTGNSVPEKQPLNETPLNRHDQKTASKSTRVSPEIQPINETSLHRHGQKTYNKKTSHDEAESVGPRRDTEMRPRSAPPSHSNQADIVDLSLDTLKEHLNFTPQEITKAISATEENKDPNARARPVGVLGSADSLGQILEIGLLLQKALGRDGYAYLSTAKSYIHPKPCWFMSLCLETMRLEMLIHRTYDSNGHPYIMAWPRCLSGNYGQFALEGAPRDR